jgi:hypothetical protein
MVSGTIKGRPKLNKSKRTPAHNLADKNYIERQKEAGVKPRKFSVTDDENQCLREVEKFIKKKPSNIKLIIDIIGNR